MTDLLSKLVQTKSTLAATGGKSPSYPWYPRDFAMDPAVIQMEPMEELLYRRLLDYQWLDGAVPSKIEAIAKAARLPIATVRKAWPAVEKQFPTANGPRKNGRMERVREEMAELRRKKSEAGKKGAEITWHSHTSANGTTDGKPVAEPMANRWPAVAVAVALPELLKSSGVVLDPSLSPRDQRTGEPITLLPPTEEDFRVRNEARALLGLPPSAPLGIVP